MSSKQSNKRKQKEISEETPEKLAFEPPETEYIAERYVVRLPITDERLNKPWELRLYAAKAVKAKVGDEVQVTSLKVKHPGTVRKTAAKLLRRVPQARIYVITKF